MTIKELGAAAAAMVEAEAAGRCLTFLLPAHTVEAAKTVAPDGNMSAFVDRALRNETLRTQLASTPLPEVPGWLDDAETDELGAA